MWPNPIKPLSKFSVDQSQEIKKIADLLALRRYEVAALEPQVLDFAKAHSQDLVILGAVFGQTFKTLSTRRTKVIKGIGRFSLGQIALAEAIETTRLAMLKKAITNRILSRALTFGTAISCNSASTASREIAFVMRHSFYESHSIPDPPTLMVVAQHRPERQRKRQQTMYLVPAGSPKLCTNFPTVAQPYRITPRRQSEPVYDLEK